MKLTLLLTLLVSLGVYVQADEIILLEQSKQALVQERELNDKRESGFKTDEQKLMALRDELIAQKKALQANIDELADTFSHNEKQLAEKEKKLHLESGSLGEFFGVVRQVAKELQIEQQDSVITIGNAESLALVDAIVAAKTLPSRAQLYSLWDAFTIQIKKGAEFSRVSVPFTQPDGEIGNKEVLRLGAFGLVNYNGYLIWAGANRGVKAALVQPDYAPTMEMKTAGQLLVSLDPTAGKLVEQLSLDPTMWQRVEQGGAIGKVILTLLILGIVIGLMQGAFLFTSRMKINAQLKDKENIGNNALGRVLSVYKYDQSPNAEALELRLFETVLDEQQKLERGLSLLKLFAALAPMLGLLGTVTGMIETFQVITQYGNADPRMMASGISTALVTTVLGLIAAMPLLFLHNVLSSLAEHVRTLLEKQGVGLVAQKAEQIMSTN